MKNNDADRIDRQAVRREYASDRHCQGTGRNKIMAQHGIEAIQTQDEAADRLDDLFGKRKRAEDENDAIEAALRNYI